MVWENADDICVRRKRSCPLRHREPCENPAAIETLSESKCLRLSFRIGGARPRSRDAFCIRGIVPMRSQKGPRARGTPRGPVDPRKFRKKTRKSAFSPASRARCLRFAPHVPRWSEFSNHRCEPRRHLAAWRGVTASPPKRLVTPTCGAGTVRLGPPRVGCACCTRARPPLSGPALDASRSALGWTGLGAL